MPIVLLLGQLRSEGKLRIVEGFGCLAILLYGESTLSLVVGDVGPFLCNGKAFDATEAVEFGVFVVSHASS